MGWDWCELSKADRLAVAAVSLEWKNLRLSPQRQRIQKEVGSGIVPSALNMQHWGPGSHCSPECEVDCDQDGEGMGTRPGANGELEMWDLSMGHLRRASMETWKHACCLPAQGQTQGVEGTGCQCELSLSRLGLSPHLLG